MVTPDINDVQGAVGARYEVLDVIGTGGMGAVFRAQHRELGHLVAIKVLPPEIAGRCAKCGSGAKRTAAHLSHPTVVLVHEFETREGITYLIMPFQGHTLQAMLLGGNGCRLTC
jgi:serine/threonine protein kinase